MSNIFKEIAKRNNTTEAIVRKEITAAINEAKKCPYPEAQRFWQAVGNAPLEDIIKILSKMI